MAAPALHFTHTPLLTKATVDDARVCVVAVMTYPVTDLAGDYISPTGGDYSHHKSLPWCGLEHYRLRKGTRDELVYPDHPDAGKPIVAGWLRESLAEPDAPYAVEMKAFTIKGERHALPVATIYYDRDNRLSNQVFALVKADALPGVSLELQAPDGYTPTVLKARSPLEPHRPAWRYDRWECRGLVNCAKPVNPGALVAKSRRDDALAKVLADRHVVTDQGTREALHPLILKSLARYAPAPDKSRVVVEKAMDPTLADGATPAEPTVYDDAHAETAGEEQGTPTAQAAYDAAQMCMDMCAQIESALEGSEHKSGKKAMLKLCEQLKAIAEKAIAVGDKVVADVSVEGEGDAKSFDEDEEPEVEDDATEPDDEDDEKRMKAFRKPERQIYCKSVRRFTARELAEAPVVTPAEPEPGNSPEDLERLEKARRLFRKTKFIYG